MALFGSKKGADEYLNWQKEKEEKKNNNYAKIMVCRCSPFTNGHKRIVDKMLYDCEYNNDALIVLGSSISKQSMRNIFTYSDRKRFIRKIYPKIQIIGHADSYDDIGLWAETLNDTLKTIFGDITYEFYGGSKEDLWYTMYFNSKNNIIGRNEISGTEVRDKLISNKPIDDYVPNEIKNDIINTFKVRWKEFKNK